MKIGIGRRKYCIPGLFHVVWSVFAVVFFTLILFLSFSTDHNLVSSNDELHWSFTGFCSGFYSLRLHPSLIKLLSYGSNKYVCCLSHSDKLELSFKLLFEGREEREELSSDSTISSVDFGTICAQVYEIFFVTECLGPSVPKCMGPCVPRIYRFARFHNNLFIDYRDFLYPGFYFWVSINSYVLF